MNVEIGALRLVLKAHDCWQPIATKIMMPRERHDVAKTLTPEQEGALLGASARTGLARHTATVLALNTAMEKDETRLLRWSQVDFE